MKKYYKYIKSYIVPLILILLLTFGGVILGLLQPNLFGKIIDNITTHNANKVKSLGALILLVSILSGLLSSISSYLLTKTGINIATDIKNKFYSTIIKLPLKKWSEMKSGELISRFETDIMEVAELLTSILIDFVMNLFSVIIVVMFLTNISVKLFLVLIIFFPISLVVERYFANILYTKAEKAREKNDEYLCLFSDTLKGILEIKTYLLENVFIDKMRSAQKKYVNTMLDKSKTRIMNQYSKILIFAILDIVILFLGVKKILTEEITIGLFVAFTNYSMKFYNSLNGVIKVWSDISEAKVSFLRVTEFEEKTCCIKEENDIASDIFLDIDGAISMNNVSFSYDETRVINEFTAIFKQRECSLLLGESGIGKTTILKLLMKFYLPVSGQIFYNGVDLNTISDKILREKVVYLSQNPYFFNTSIRENFKLVNKSLDDKKIYSILKDVGLYEMVSSLPKKLETMLAEAGSNFSEGQKQRLNIARAIAKDPEFFLLDEPTSSLDYENKEIITNTIIKLSESYTVILVTHDDYVIKKMQETDNSVSYYL